MSERRTYTPGPWKWVADDTGGAAWTLVHEFKVPTGEMQQQMIVDLFDASDYNCAGNLALIAAAPQLIEALEAVEWVYGDEDNYCACCSANKSDGHALNCKIAAALKAAKGEQP